MNFLRKFALFNLVLMLALPLRGVVKVEEEAGKPTLPPKDVAYLKIVQLVEGDVLQRQYADALPSLLEEIRRRTTLNVDPFPIYIDSFEDEVIFKHPVIYVNFADRMDWTLTPGEIRNLRLFIERGGFFVFGCRYQCIFSPG